jgi:aspartate aminotransferase
MYTWRAAIKQVIQNQAPGLSESSGEVLMFENLDQLPPDPILGLLTAYREDPNPRKVDLGIGVYKDEQGDTPIMAAVTTAQQIHLANETTKTYVGPAGDERFNAAIGALLFGTDHAVIKDDRLTTIQTPGGCGAVRMAAEFIKRSNPDTTVWVSNPTWANHIPLLGDSGLHIEQYPYYDHQTHCIQFEQMVSTLKQAGKNDVVLLHGCCHNPCGADLTRDQWQVVSNMAVNQGFLPLVDIAYQGLGESVSEDAFGTRLLANQVPELIVASSCSKNFGLYRERTGSVNLIMQNAKQLQASQSQMLSITRGVYSMPPAHGASIVATILNDAELSEQWAQELAQMCARINDLRSLLVRKIRDKGINADFSFIEAEKGMFSFLAISPEQVHRLKNEFSIYMVDSSRINVAGISHSNIDYLVESLHQVL